MKIQCVTPEEYGILFPSPSHIYNTVAFNRLNSAKCESVLYLAFEDEKGNARLGIIVGDNGEDLKSPFSAPFGGFDERGKQRLQHYIEAAEELKKFADDLGRKIIITLPPPIYDRNSRLAKQHGALITAGFETAYSDFDYFSPDNIGQTFHERMSPAARNKLRTAMAKEYSVKICSSTDANVHDEIAKVYSLIEENRAHRHYPLRMSLDEVLKTVDIIPTDFMILTLDGVDVAAAMIYHVTDKVVQVIYWGDRPGYSISRPMNMLAEKVMTYYSRAGKIIDVGPASSNGTPSLGLCDFKESIGCEMTLKPTLIYGGKKI